MGASCRSAGLHSCVAYPTPPHAPHNERRGVLTGAARGGCRYVPEHDRCGSEAPADSRRNGDRSPRLALLGHAPVNGLRGSDALWNQLGLAHCRGSNVYVGKAGADPAMTTASRQVISCLVKDALQSQDPGLRVTEATGLFLGPPRGWRLVVSSLEAELPSVRSASEEQKSFELFSTSIVHRRRADNGEQVHHDMACSEDAHV